MDRSNWDKIVSGAGAVIAVVLIALGATAIFGGNFGQQNVRDRLVPQNITFPPFDAMSPEEKADIGEFAGQKVETGVQAEAFSRYIGGHLVGSTTGRPTRRRVRPHARKASTPTPRRSCRGRPTPCSRVRRSGRCS